ncbi:MAG: hypothetical protein R6X35_02570 [Candidatus Krumholzibacteriia bacterium]
MRRAARLVPALLACLLLAAVPGCNEQDAGFVLPADLVALLPAAPSALVACPGLESMDRALADLDARAGAEPVLPPALREKLDLAALLHEAVPGLGAAADPTRPLALALVLPPPMVQSEPLVTLVVPLRDPTAAPPAPADVFRALVVNGRYAAYSTDPALAVSDSVPALASDLRPGLLAGAMDLAGIVAQYRGLMEMGLGMMAMGAGQGAGAAEGATPAMSPEEAVAVAKMMRGLMDSVRRLDFALDLDEGTLALSSLLGLTADAPLSPAADADQPDFARAAALTGLLPADADLLQAWAANQGPEMAFMRDVYLAGARKEAARLPAEQAAAYEAWFQGYLDLIPRLACPAAAAMDFGEDGLGLLAVLEPDDPAALADALAGQMDALTAAGTGLAFVPLEPTEVAGGTVRRWRVAFDDAALAAGLAPDAAAGRQTAQTLLALGDLLPEVSLTTVGTHTVLGATTGDGDFARLLERVAAGGGKPDPRVAAAAKAAGPDCRQVVVGDAMPVANWLIGLAAELEADGLDELPHLEQPVPFTSTATMGAAGYGFTVTTDVPAIRAAVAAVEAMVAAQQDTLPGSK